MAVLRSVDQKEVINGCYLMRQPTMRSTGERMYKRAFVKFVKSSSKLERNPFAVGALYRDVRLLLIKLS